MSGKTRAVPDQRPRPEWELGAVAAGVAKDFRATGKTIRVSLSLLTNPPGMFSKGQWIASLCQDILDTMRLALAITLTATRRLLRSLHQISSVFNETAD